MNNKNIDLKDILNTIDTINSKNYAFHVYVPSLRREVPFLQINTAQQKTLIKSVIDSPVYNTEFIFTIRNIIQENCMEKDIVVDSLTLLDKLAISLALRSKSIGNIYNGTFKYNDIELKHSIELDPLIETIKAIEIEDEQHITLQDYKLVVGAPTIGREYFVERDLRAKNRQQSTAIETNEQLRTVIGEAFVTELVKYVRSIEIPRGDEELRIDFTTLPPKSALEILSKLPVKVLEKVLEFANEYNFKISKVTKVRVPTGIDPETNEVKYVDQEVQVNGDFFIIS